MLFPLDTYILIIPSILLYITLIYLVSFARKNAGTLDIAWGPGFIVIATLLYLYFGFVSTTQIFISILVLLWGMRLFLNILIRNGNKPEDKRYTEMKKGWKYPWISSYPVIFLPQAFFMLIIASPIILANSYNVETNVTGLFLGTLTWIIGFTFESMGDLQLMLFLKKPENKGKILTSGLWSLTRHPNYFGEIAQWWGIFVIIISGFGLSGLWTIISPLAITWLLLKVSGIPLLEKHYEGNKEFGVYKAKTNALIPWFPKK
jgi:steroid 5-alpha reductase family enzyme